MGCHFELSLVTEYVRKKRDERVWTEVMLTRQGANEVRIDRGVRWGGACSDQRPGPKFSLLLVINKEANQDVRETQDEERGQNTKGLIWWHIPGLNLPDKHPSLFPPSQQLLGLMETIY